MFCHNNKAFLFCLPSNKKIGSGSATLQFIVISDMFLSTRGWKILADLKKTLKKHGEQKDSVLPLEMSYLNKNAFISVVGHQPQVTKLLIIT